MKHEIFNEQLGLIKNPMYLKDAKYLLEQLPNYFYEVAASSTGKYHPGFALGEGGLVRHTKVFIMFLNELLNHPIFGADYSDDEKDLFIIGALIHDGLKHGKEKSQYVVFEHPLLAAEFLLEHQEGLSFSDLDIEFLTKIIKSHMGPWHTSNYSKFVLPIPKTKAEEVFHLADYLASRKFIDVKFED